MIHNSILCPEAESTCSKKWIKRIIPRAFPPIFPSTDVKEAILCSFRKSGGQLTRGETSLKNHGIFENLSRVCRPNASTTEAILVWHIATFFFHHQKSRTQRYTFPVKEREVALALSSYCHYLVVSLPELLPDEVEWTKKMYETVKEEIFDIDRSSGEKPTVQNRCNYAMDNVRWKENSVVEKGAKLAKELVIYDADNAYQVWTMLSEFWAEMMLFIAPSDNVKGHEEILEKVELITQLWALLTHAGIVTRPKPTQEPNQGMENNEGPEIAIANGGMENNEGPEIAIANGGMENNEGSEIAIANGGMENNEGPEIAIANGGMENNEGPEIAIANGGVENNEGPEIPIAYRGMENNEGPEIAIANRGMENNEDLKEIKID